MLADPQNRGRRVRFRLGGVEGSGDPLSAGIRPEFRFRQGAGSATTGGEHVRKQRLVAAGITMLAADAGSVGLRHRERRPSGASGEHRDQGREDRRDRTIVRRSFRRSAWASGTRVDLAIRQANEKNTDPGLEARAGRPGRSGHAGRRQERGDQAGGRRRRGRRGRHPELVGVAQSGPAGAQLGHHRPDLAGQHQPDA